MEERRTLELVLNDCKKWECEARSLLDDGRCLFELDTTVHGISSGLLFKVEDLIARIQSAITSGVSLGFDFSDISKLQASCSTLEWCKRALCFCNHSPCLEVIVSLYYNHNLCSQILYLHRAAGPPTPYCLTMLLALSSSNDITWYWLYCFIHYNVSFTLLGFNYKSDTILCSHNLSFFLWITAWWNCFPCGSFYFFKLLFIYLFLSLSLSLSLLKYV